MLERNIQFEEIQDEDGDSCENIALLTNWVQETLLEALRLKKFSISAINFSTYGASFVYINEDGKVVAPLYNYLKSFPTELKDEFYSTYGSENKISLETSSPVLDSLNSGMQLYRIKKQRPALFNQIKYALHLPQYISYLITKKAFTDITSIGCHTQLWHFKNNDYHGWVASEGIYKNLPPLFSSSEVTTVEQNGHSMKVGVGLHDSSAALIPYLANFREPFILISTGTWCISFNPFNHAPLTSIELQQDCLCYMEYNGKPVKASRLFAGYEHEQQTKRLAEHFNKKTNYYKDIDFDPALLDEDLFHKTDISTRVYASRFSEIDLNDFSTYEIAYHRFMQCTILQQYASTSIIMNDDITRIFVDGGFSKNAVYMNLLSAMFPGKEIFAATVAQATAVGAALAIHKHWNSKPVAADMIELKLYATAQKTIV